MISTLVNRSLIVLSAFFNKRVIQDNNKRVLLVFAQIYGDAILFSEALMHYKEIYKKEDGFSITLLVRPNIHAFLDELFEIDDDIDVKDIDFTRFLNDYRYYKECVKEYLGKYSILIVPGTTLSAEVFAKSSDANRKIGLLRANYMQKPLYRAYFNRYSYTETVQPKKDDMVLQCHAQLLNYLAGEDMFHAELPHARTVRRIIDDEHYCVMAIGSSMSEKQWPVERFAEVADYIIGKYAIKVHLCGTEDEKEIEKAFRATVKNKKSIVSHVGNTPYLEWLSLVQWADFVVGNDSATVHLAAATGTNSIAIVGMHEKGRFFPYKCEASSMLPIALLHDVSCAWCKTKDYEFGYGNSECKKMIKSGRCAMCIDAVKAEEVKESISAVYL